MIIFIGRLHGLAGSKAETAPHKLILKFVHTCNVTHIQDLCPLCPIDQELTERKFKCEGTLREVRSKLSVLEDEHQRAKQELSTLRHQNATIDAQLHEQDKAVNQLRTRLAVAEQEVKDKEEVMRRTSDLLGTEQDHKVQAGTVMLQQGYEGSTVCKITLLAVCERHSFVS